MSLAEVTDRLRERTTSSGGLDRSVKFDFGRDGVVVVGGADTPTRVGNEDVPADCTIAISMDNFLKLTAGKLNPQFAFVTGKMRVRGEMGVAMRLRSLLG